jgi:hypothetical protein
MYFSQGCLSHWDHCLSTRTYCGSDNQGCIPQTRLITLPHFREEYADSQVCVDKGRLEG